MTDSKPMRIGIAGLGTVGAATAKILVEESQLLAERCGRSLMLTAVSARNKNKQRDFAMGGVQWFDDPVALAGCDRVDLVVEAIGGAEGAARDTVETALAHGKHVVTANKALIAHHGQALAGEAEAKNLALAFEAAVAGGIPVLKALREGLAANRIQEVRGILNGTSNYILSTMRSSGRDFADVLGEAQTLGYAEANPSFDIDGVDSAHKLAILTALAFGRQIDFAGVRVEGIRNIDASDIAYASELGYRIKLLATASLGEDGTLQQVQPCLVSAASALGAVEGVFNAVEFITSHAGAVVLQGRGAGGGPTASAIIADILDIARGCIVPAFGLPAAALAPAKQADPAKRASPYYLRLKVRDEPGVVADITAILRDNQVSLESVLQRGHFADATVPLVLVTHMTEDGRMRAAASSIAALAAVTGQPCLIPIVKS